MGYFTMCSTHMPKEEGGIYAVITRAATTCERKILQENRYLYFGRYLGDDMWQIYDEIDLNVTKLEETAKDVIPQEGLVVPVPDLLGKDRITDTKYHEEVIAYCPLGKLEEIRELA